MTKETEPIPAQDQPECAGGTLPSAEQVSNEETSKKYAELAEIFVKTLIMKGEMGIANIISFPDILLLEPDEIAAELGRVIAMTFVFFDEGSGHHTIADTIDGELAKVKRHAELFDKIFQMLDDEVNYLPNELEDKKRRARQKEIEGETKKLINQLDDMDKKHKVKQLLLGVTSRPKIIKKLEKLQLEHDELERKITTPILPIATHALYEETFQGTMELQQERDCKVPAAVLGYTLVYFQKTFHVPVQVRFATVRSFPHPYVEVSHGENFSQKTFFDYSPKAFSANINKPRMMELLEIDEVDNKTAHPLVIYHEVNEKGLRQLDLDYLMYKENNPQVP